MRSYNEYCAVAQALDLVGERWTLLIVRELLVRGSCRYTDLQYGLPGIATNLLAERLKEMEQAGLIRREAARPPVATTLFRLTERGAALKPVIEAIARWGSPLVTRPIGNNRFRSHWLKLPLEMYLTDRFPDEPPVTIEIRAGEEPIMIETGGGIRVSFGHAQAADAVIAGSGSLVLGLMLGFLDLEEARRRGLTLEGTESALRRVQPEARQDGAAFLPGTT